MPASSHPKNLFNFLPPNLKVFSIRFGKGQGEKVPMEPLKKLKKLVRLEIRDTLETVWHELRFTEKDFSSLPPSLQFINVLGAFKEHTDIIDILKQLASLPELTMIKLGEKKRNLFTSHLKDVHSLEVGKLFPGFEIIRFSTEFKSKMIIKNKITKWMDGTKVEFKS